MTVDDDSETSSSSPSAAPSGATVATAASSFIAKVDLHPLRGDHSFATSTRHSCHNLHQQQQQQQRTMPPTPCASLQSLLAPTTAVAGVQDAHSLLTPSAECADPANGSHRLHPLAIAAYPDNDTSPPLSSSSSVDDNNNLPHDPSSTRDNASQPAAMDDSSERSEIDDTMDDAVDGRAFATPPSSMPNSNFLQPHTLLGFLSTPSSPANLSAASPPSQISLPGTPSHTDAALVGSLSTTPLISSTSITPVSAINKLGLGTPVRVTSGELDSSSNCATPLASKMSPYPSALSTMTALQHQHNQQISSLLSLSRDASQLPPLPAHLTTIVNTFSNLQASTQSTLLVHLLSKVASSETLRLISSLILPQLRHDFFSHLPVELSHQILEYLDLRSLARCARACRAWNRVADGPCAEVGVWKRRLVDEGWFDPREVEKEQQLMRMEMRRGGILSASESVIVVGAYKRCFRRHWITRVNWAKGRCRRLEFPGHGNSVVTCLQFDDEKIVSGSDDMSIHVYDAQTGRLRQKLLGHEGGVWALQYWRSQLVSGSTDRTVRVWDMDTGRCTHIFEGHTSTVRCLLIVVPPEEDSASTTSSRLVPAKPQQQPLIITGSRDMSLRVWRLPPVSSSAGSTSIGSSAGYLMHTLTGHSNSVRAIAASSTVLVSGSYDATVRVWDLERGEALWVFHGHREKVYSVGYCEELARCASGSMDTTVRVWCTRTGTALFVLEGHSSLVGLLELTRSYLVSAAADATIRLWSPTTGACLATLTGHSAAITCFHHDPRLNRLVSGSDGGVKAWELSSAPGNHHSSSLNNAAAASRASASSSSSSTAATAAAPLPPHALRALSTTTPGGAGFAFSQSPIGAIPLHGRFLRDIVGRVMGVWRVRMDERRMVCAVQRDVDGGETWFEAFDFGEGVEVGDVCGVGDLGFAPQDGEEDVEEEDEDDDDEVDDDVVDGGDGDDEDGDVEVGVGVLDGLQLFEHGAFEISAVLGGSVPRGQQQVIAVAAERASTSGGGANGGDALGDLPPGWRQTSMVSKSDDGAAPSGASTSSSSAAMMQWAGSVWPAFATVVTDDMDVDNGESHNASMQN